MAFRIAGDRVTLTVEGASIEVSPIVAWPIAHTAVRLALAYHDAKSGDAEFVALRELGEFLVAEAQPSWDIEDHRGRVPATPAGMLRLPIDMTLALVQAWIDTIVPKQSAADVVLPPGPVRDEVKRRLRSVKAA